jgi:LPXTG-motif cell wall-anchored protein
MEPFLPDLVADLSPGPPLIGNNIVFYTVFGAALLALLFLVLWIRRRGRGA